MLDKISGSTNGFFLNNSAKDLQLNSYTNYITSNIPFGNSQFDTYNPTNPINIKIPNKTPVNKRMSIAEKVGIGALVTVGLAIGADYLFCKGKHVNSLLKAFKSEQKQVIKESENLADDVATSVKKSEIKFAKEAETKATQEAKLALKKTAEETKAKTVIIENSSDETICSISTTSNGKTHNIHVQNGKNAASSNCYIDGFQDIYGYNPKGYVDKNGMISGLYLNNLNSSGGGMGTEAVKRTVLWSKELGQEGRVYLHASVTNKVKGTPVPFYNKIGFKAMDKSIQEEIEKGMQSLAQNGIYTGPKDTTMYLPLENISTLLR